MYFWCFLFLSFSFSFIEKLIYHCYSHFFTFNKTLLFIKLSLQHSPFNTPLSTPWRYHVFYFSTLSFQHSPFNTLLATPPLSTPWRSCFSLFNTLLSTLPFQHPGGHVFYFSTLSFHHTPFTTLLSTTPGGGGHVFHCFFYFFSERTNTIIVCSSFDHSHGVKLVSTYYASYTSNAVLLDTVQWFCK